VEFLDDSLVAKFFVEGTIHALTLDASLTQDGKAVVLVSEMLCLVAFTIASEKDMRNI